LKSRLKYHLDGKSEQETQALYLKSHLKYRPDGDSEQETRELRLKSCLKYIQDAKLWVDFFPSSVYSFFFSLGRCFGAFSKILGFGVSGDFDWVFKLFKIVFSTKGMKSQH
jgi:hypothetical protein